MDRKLRKLMHRREEARRKERETQAAIIDHVKARLTAAQSNPAQNTAIRADMRRAYIIGHLAETLADLFYSDQEDFVEKDEFAQHVLDKKEYLKNGNSTDRRTKEEERAYGNAREAWSYTVKQVGIPQP